MSEPPADNVPRYDLFARHAGAGLAWRLRDRGIALDRHSLVLPRANKWIRVPFADIASVGLSRQGVGRMKLAQCLVTLRNGRRIVITNANARGVNDGRHDEPFRLFINDLHHALRAAGSAAAIRFVLGDAGAWMKGLIFIGALATLFFIALPLVVVLATRNLPSLWALLFGAGFLIPVWGLVQIKRPRTYDPASPPDIVA